MNSSDPTKIILLVAGWGLAAMTFLIGLLGVAVGLWNLNQSQASESWPSVPGKILHSEIAEDTSRSRQGKTTRSDTDYEVKVRYAYEVQGRSLEGNRLRFASWSHDERSAASKELKRYPKGKEVTVYYDPENPEKTTLIKGFERWFTQIVVPAIFLLFGSILGIFLIRSMWQNPVRHSPGT